MSMKLLTEQAKWDNMKVKLTEGITGNRKTVTNVCLENTRKMLIESASIGSTNAGNIAALNKVMLPVIRRVMPGVISHEIMGVQPMQGPVAQIHTMRVQYAQTVPADGSGAIAGDEALSPFDIKRFYSGNEVVANPAGANTADLEGRIGNKLNIRILRETVTARSRRLSANYTIEAMQDAQSQHNMDIEAELMAVLAQEITAEIDQEMLFKLRTLAGAPAVTYNQAGVSGVAASVVDEHAALAVLVQQQANRVAQRTRRGQANWAVVGQNALTILQSARASGFARTTSGTFDAPTNTKFVGTLNENIKVYSDTYASENEAVLIGYKGQNETDAAAYYCPYIPLMSSTPVMDPNTGEFVVTFLSRYGYLELSNTANSLGNAADYLSRIGITGVRFF